MNSITFPKGKPRILYLILHHSPSLHPSLPLCYSDKEIDLSTVDLSKLKVRDLRKILTDMGEVCSGCVEKSEFVSKIRTVAGLKSEL